MNKVMQHTIFPTTLFLVFTFFFAQIHAQTVRCGTVEAEIQRYLENPDLESYEEFEAWLAKKIAEKNKQAEVGLIINGVYQIPVIVHVVHNGEAIGTGTNISAAAIQSQIEVLNEDFRRIFGTNGYNTHPDGADTQIEFCLARRRPDGTAFPAGEDGINRIDRNSVGWSAPPYSTATVNGTIKPYTTVTQNYSPSNYMNFWSVNLGSGLLGYAQFPTSILGGMGCGAQSASTDGVVMLYSSIGKSSVTGNGGVYNEGRTATHEIGHWLGLRHIWGDGGCGVDDYCLDTPLCDGANYGCATGTISCGNLDMVENYMDYSDDLCMNIFTNDQKMRMRTVLENSPIRASLITSDACVPPAVSDASIVNIINPVGDNCVGAITPIVSLRNRGSSNLTSVTINYTIDGGSPTSFAWTGTLAPGATTNVTLAPFSTTLGNHIFSSVSVLPNGVTDPNTVYDASEIAFAVSNGIQPDFLEDFDGGTFPPNVRWNVDNPNSDCFEWVGAAAVSSSGISNNACAIMTNFGNTSGQDEYFYTPIFILPCNASVAEMRFDVAYRRRTTAINDRLRVEISTDCGATWNPTSIYDKSGAVLHTNTTALNSYWIPTASTDWRNEVVDLSSFVSASSSSVRFRFRGTNTGASGGNIYIDNVELLTTTPGEVNVQYLGSDVLDGGFANALNLPIGSTSTLTFNVQNTGNSNLTLTAPITLTGASEFALNSSFGSTTVAAGSSTTFTVDFTPTGAGPYSTTITFATNDCDESAYNFTLNGTGNTTPPTANFSGTPTVFCAGESVVYTDLSTGAASWSWSFPGGTPNTATGAGPHTILYSTSGIYDASLTATNIFGSDSETKTNYVNALSNTSSSLPISEGFVSATFPPTDWSITNGGNGITWERDPTQGTAPTVGNSLFIDNWSTATTGDIDDLNVVPVNLTGLSSAQLSFDVAHARYSAAFIDRLDVLISVDCGQTYTNIYSKSGSALATEVDQTAEYLAPTTWRNEVIDLTPYVGASKADLKIRNISGYGNNIFVDNINITGVTSATADFTTSTVPACVGQTVTFTDASTSATSWSWDFGANASPATATGVGPHNVTYSSGGTKNVSLSINASASVSNQTITIDQPSIAPTAILGAGNACHGAIVNLSANGGTLNGSSVYEWFSGSCGGIALGTGNSINVNPLTTTTYFVRASANGSCAATSCFNADIVLPTAGSTLANNLETGTCLVNQNGYVHFYHASGRLLASINSNGQDLGNVSVTAYVGTAANIPACDEPSYSSAFMGRNYVITPTIQPTNPVNVLLYFDDAELSSLMTIANSNTTAADDVSTIADLVISKYSGPTNVDGNAANNCVSAGGNGGATLVVPTSSGNTETIISGFSANGRYLGIDISGFSEFWFGGNAGTPLATNLVYFNVDCIEPSSAKISWQTASEQNCVSYKVEKSRDGESWTELETVPCHLFSNELIDYEVFDAEFLNNAAYYRLVEVNTDGVAEVLQTISSECWNQAAFSATLFPNPAENQTILKLHSAEQLNDLKIVFVDSHGKQIQQLEVEKFEGSALFPIDLSNFSAGAYFIYFMTDTKNLKPLKLIVH